MINRDAVNYAVSQAILFQQRGKHAAAEKWAAHLLGLLGMASIIHPDAANLKLIALRLDIDLPR